MAAGYEARARITADVSGFVAGARSVASASNSAAAAVRSLTTQLLVNSQAATRAASTIQAYSKSASAVSASLSQNSQAMLDASRNARDMARAYNDGAEAAQRAGEAYNNTSQAQANATRSASQLGRQMETVAGKLAVLEQIQRSGTRLNHEQAQAMTTLRGRAAELQQQYGKLSEEGRKTADAARAMERANSTVRSSLSGLTRDIREQVSEQRRSAQTSQMSTAALERMGQQLNRLRAEQERYQSIVAQGRTLTRDEAESNRRLQSTINDLTRDFIRLSPAQREVVRGARELAQASRLGASAAQEYSAAQTRLVQTGRLTHTQLQQLGRQLQQVSQQYTALNRDTQARGQATQAEATAMRTLQQALTSLISTYRQLDASQRGVVNNARAMVGATSAAAAATRNLAASGRDASTSLNGLDGSLWSLRSALGDLQGFLTQITSSFRRAATNLAQTFSEQEMAIAHISRVTQATMGEMDTLTAGIRELAAVIPLPFQELGHIARLGAQVGIANDAILGFTHTVALFSATTDVTSEAASTMFARIQQMTDIDDTKFRNLGASVSELGSNSAATEQEILTVVESISTMATQAGMTGESIIGLGAAMASLRVRPEIARGATQRVFLQLSSAVEDAGSEMERLAELTGLSGDELQKLAASDFDQFFMRVMEGLHGASESGQNLVPVLRELGIQNSRDAEVIARLAGNYDVLSRSMDLAHESFERGTYLQREAERIFQTLTAQVQLMSNAWDELKFAIVASIGPFVEILVRAATAVVRFVSESEVLVFILGQLLIAGAVAAAFAGLVAIVSGSIQAWIALRTALGLGVLAMGLMTQSAVASATTMGLLAGAARGAGAALLTSAKSAGVAATAFRVLAGVMRLIAPIAFISAIVAAIQAVDRLTSSAMELNQAHLDAAGGMDSLKQAMIDDTQAALDSADAIVHRREAVQDMSEEDRNAASAARDLEHNQDSLARQLNVTRDSAEDAGSAVEESAEAARSAEQAARHSSGGWSELEAAMISTGAAIGEANGQFAALMTQSVITESGILSNTEAFKEFQAALREFGGLGGVVEAELGNAGDGADQAREAINNLQEEMGFLERNLGLSAALLATMTGGFADFRTDTWLAVDALADFESGLDGLSEAQVEALNNLGLFQGELVRTEDGTVELIGGLDELGDEMDEVQTASEAAAEALEGVIAAARGASDPLDQLREDGEALAMSWNEAFDSLSQSMGDALTYAFDLAALQAKGMSDAAVEFMANNRDIFEQHMDELGDMTEEELRVIDEVLRFMAGDLDTELGEIFQSIQENAAETGDTAGEELARGIIDGIADGSVGTQEGMEALRMIAEETINEGNYELAERVIENIQDGTFDVEQGMEALRMIAEETINDTNFEMMETLLASISDGSVDVETGMATIRSIVEGSLAEVDFDIIQGLVAGINDGSVDVQTAMEAIRMLAEGELDNGEYNVDLEIQGEERLKEQLDLIIAEAEKSLEEGDYPITPEVEDEPARQEMEDLADDIELTAADNEAIFTPAVERDPSEIDMAALSDYLELLATQSLPVYTPETDGSEAERGMRSTRGNIEKTASDSTPTVRARTDGSQAERDMSGIMGRLRSLATTIWVSVRGQSGGMAVGSGRKADGGWVSGPGGPRQDKIPMWLSNKEFVVNAQDASDYAPLLEWINSRRGRGGGEIPSSVPANIMQLPSAPITGRTMAPESVQGAQRTRMDMRSPGMVINVNNTYPQAEPTSMTINRSMAYVAALDGSLTS